MIAGKINSIRSTVTFGNSDLTTGSDAHCGALVAATVYLQICVLWTSVGMNCTLLDVGLKATKNHKSLNCVLTSNKTHTDI
jgi:hypothetical protein